MPSAPLATASTVRAKYVVGCDGSRSAVRTAIGRELKGDGMNVSWGVMDVLSSTDFPDIRLKCTIQSASHGSIVLIPRGWPPRQVLRRAGKRQGQDILAAGGASVEKITAAANRILNPYVLG